MVFCMVVLPLSNTKSMVQIGISMIVGLALKTLFLLQILLKVLELAFGQARLVLFLIFVPVENQVLKMGHLCWSLASQLPYLKNIIQIFLELHAL